MVEGFTSEIVSKWWKKTKTAKFELIVPNWEANCLAVFDHACVSSPCWFYLQRSLNSACTCKLLPPSLWIHCRESFTIFRQNLPCQVCGYTIRVLWKSFVQNRLKISLLSPIKDYLCINYEQFIARWLKTWRKLSV